MLKVKVYADRMSQPSRAVLIFCKVNGIEFDEIKVEISKRQQLSPEFAAINPFKKLPAIVDGRFKQFERYVKSKLNPTHLQIQRLSLCSSPS
nr:glutathione S-transferase T1 isoform X1 [Arachis hypogaea]